MRSPTLDLAGESVEQFARWRNVPVFVESPVLVGGDDEDVSAGLNDPMPFLQGLDRVEKMLDDMRRQDVVERVVLEWQVVSERHDVHDGRRTGLVLPQAALLVRKIDMMDRFRRNDFEVEAPISMPWRFSRYFVANCDGLN